MSIPRINQIPLNQPMYVNGQLHQAWIDFFQKVGGVADETGVYSLSGMNDAIVAMQKNIATNVQELQSINKKITAIQENITSMNDAINSLQNAVSTNTSDISTLKDEYSNLDKRVTDLEKAT